MVVGVVGVVGGKGGVGRGRVRLVGVGIYCHVLHLNVSTDSA